MGKAHCCYSRTAGPQCPGIARTLSYSRLEKDGLFRQLLCEYREGFRGIFEVSNVCAGFLESMVGVDWGTVFTSLNPDRLVAPLIYSWSGIPSHIVKSTASSEHNHSKFKQLTSHCNC